MQGWDEYKAGYQAGFMRGRNTDTELVDTDAWFSYGEYLRTCLDNGSRRQPASYVLAGTTKCSIRTVHIAGEPDQWVCLCCRTVVATEDLVDPVPLQPGFYHNHVTRDMKPPGECPACDRWYVSNHHLFLEFDPTKGD